MKHLALALLFFTTLLPIRADEELKNTDFADGRSHWEGDGESLAAAVDAAAAPSLGATPSSAQAGLLLKLSRRDWTRVTQNFRPLHSEGILTVTYKFSDDLVFSKDIADYTGVPALMGFTSYRPFNIKPGNWIALFIESATSEMEYYNITPKPGPDAQTYKGNIHDLVPRVDKTLCLAFPPGTGSITIIHVGLDTH